MWNIFFVGLLVCASCLADVSHLKHGGYPSDKPEHPLELPGEGSTNTASVGYPKVIPENPLPLPEASNGDSSVSGYPKVVPENRLKIPEASSGSVRTQVPDAEGEGTSSGGVIATQQTTKNDHKHDHYHGQDGKYDHHDDGRGWDIRKSVPGEPGQDYPTYDSVPSTSFTCKEKAPGYYADEEARCQVFRICTTNSLKTYNSFLCPNGSLFNQRVLTCDWWMNVDCTSSSDFYYKNQEIGKMPTGQQLMYEVTKMLEAPNNRPYHFNQQQQQFLDQTLQDNQIQGTGTVQDFYLPAKQPVITTTKAYYTPTIPTTTSTTTTTTQKPIIMSTLNRVDTNKNTFNQQTFQNVNNRQREDELKQSTVKNVENQYIPPPVQKVDQTSLSSVKNQQNKIQVGSKTTVGELHVSQVLKTSPELHVSPSVKPRLHLSKQVTNKPPQPLFVSPPTKQSNQLFSGSKTEQNTVQGEGKLHVSPVLKTSPELHVSKQIISKPPQPLFVSPPVGQTNQLSASSMLSSHDKPSRTDGQLFTSKLPDNNPRPFVSPSDNKPTGQLFTSMLTQTNNAQPLFVSQVAMKENKLFTSPERPVQTNNNNNKTLFISPPASTTATNISKVPPKASESKDQLFLSQIDQSSSSGLSGYDYQKQVPSVVTTQQVTNQNQQPQQNPSVTVTKEQTQTVTHSQKTTHVFQNVNEGPEKISLLQPVPSISTGSVVQNQQKDQNLGIQQQAVVQTQQKTVPSGFDITKEQAFQQIDNIQSGLQQLNQQQETIQKFGGNVLNPRKNPQNIPVPDFGQNIVFSGVPFQNIPQGFSHQGVQPNIYPEPNYPVDAYLQNQGGYQYQPNFHEQNLQNYNFHGQNSGQNFNVDVNRDGSAQNYKGESLTQHNNGQTHSTYSGHNVAFKESTKVDIVPSLGFHLNDDYEKNSYISAVLGGLINDGPQYQPSGPDNFGQGQFLPSDVRFSSYQGPSSYIVPQGSVQRLPSDSGYYR